MRNVGYGRPFHSQGTTIFARTFNYNVTNVTNVSISHHSKHGHGGFWKKRNRKARNWGGRKPKLFRFCASAGLLDSDKVARMSNGEVCKEAANVVRYGARGIASCAGRMARSVAGGAKAFAGGVVEIAEALFS